MIITYLINQRSTKQDVDLILRWANTSRWQKKQQIEVKQYRQFVCKKKKKSSVRHRHVYKPDLTRVALCTSRFFAFSDLFYLKKLSRICNFEVQVRGKNI